MSYRVSTAGGLAAAIAAVALSCAGEASAATRAEQFDCVWNALPPARRELFIQAGPSISALFGTFNRGEPQQLAGSCGIDVTNNEGQRLTSSAVIGPAIAEGAARDMKARFGVTDARLAAAWAKFPAASRQNMSLVFENTQLLPATLADLDKLGTDLGLSLDAAGVRDRVFDLAFGRSLIERYRGAPAK